MKVLTHEADSLSADRRREANALKKAHYRLCCEQAETLKQVRKHKGLKTRLAVLSLFGMMSWIYTWCRADVDPDGLNDGATDGGDFFARGFGLAARRA